MEAATTTITKLEATIVVANVDVVVGIVKVDIATKGSIAQLDATKKCALAQFTSL